MTSTENEPRLLLATDGSRGSAVAADYAFALARSWGASLSLMNVLESPPGLDPQNPVNQLYLTELMKQAQYHPLQVWEMALTLFAVNNGFVTRMFTG